jgi:hypothetical protein
MIKALLAIPEVIFTHVINQRYACFQYGRREAIVYQTPESATLYCSVDIPRLDINRIARVNLQLVAMTKNAHLALVLHNARWWVVQSFSSDWQTGCESNLRRFLTQFAVAQWLETDFREEARSSTDFEM